MIETTLLIRIECDRCAETEIVLGDARRPDIGHFEGTFKMECEDDGWDFDQNSDYCPDCMAEERK
ncbi:MAG: hypothetical protein IT173_12025 [Acidobacteria bacterium]|nr:hypothetical protein [Acidobacteriota bacterium]